MFWVTITISETIQTNCGVVSFNHVFHEISVKQEEKCSSPLKKHKDAHFLCSFIIQ